MPAHGSIKQLTMLRHEVQPCDTESLRRSGLRPVQFAQPIGGSSCVWALRVSLGDLTIELLGMIGVILAFLELRRFKQFPRIVSCTAHGGTTGHKHGRCASGVESQ